VDHITFASNGVTVMTTSNKYDYVNRLTAIFSTASAKSVVNYQYQYNTANQRTTVTYADNSFWTYGYDALGQVSNAVKRWGDNSAVAGQQFGYGFDTIGNRRMTLAGGDQNGHNERLASYTANSLNEYTGRTVPAAVDVIGSATNTAAVWVDQTAAYRKTNYFWLQLPVTNAYGPVYQTVTTLAALSNAYGTNAEYGTTNIGHVFVPQTPESYAYDLDGNLLSDGRWSYGWDAENRLTNMTSLSGAPTASKFKLDFTYDYQGRRIQKIVSTNAGSGWVYSYTNRFVYDGWNVVAILDGGDNVLYSFTWGLDLSGSPQGAGGVGGLLSMRVYGGANAGVYFYCYDGNGNVTALVNAGNGSIAAQYEYGAFGELIRATGPMASANPFLFSTKYRDSESGFYYYGYRYYNPNTGRWLSRDPAEEDEGGLNLYGFVGNDPTEQCDALGFKIINLYFGFDKSLNIGPPGHSSKKLRALIDKQVRFFIRMLAICSTMHCDGECNFYDVTTVRGFFDDQQKEEPGSQGWNLTKPTPLGIFLLDIAAIKGPEGHYKCLLTRRSIYASVDALAVTMDNFGTLLNIETSPSWVLAHEIGHYSEYVGDAPGHHSSHSGNLMNQSGGTRPDCPWCELVAKMKEDE
jgi:RHS repeat-associated protein